MQKQHVSLQTNSDTITEQSVAAICLQEHSTSGVGRTGIKDHLYVIEIS